MQVKEMFDTWKELWWKMADGVKSEYEKIKATDVFEFYTILDLWQDKMKQEVNALKSRTKK